MLNPEITQILTAARKQGWVLEPEAKRLLALNGLDIPRFTRAQKLDEALDFAGRIGYPVVAKIVSPAVLHKSELQGVAVGVPNDSELGRVFERFRKIDAGCDMLVEEMLSGIELIVGAKVDHQFGPVILLGIGGTGVEVYQDISIRMAPLEPKDIESMLNTLKARELLDGFRGSHPVNRPVLIQMLLRFSELAVSLEGTYDSVDLNPVICTPERCLIADARIMLKTD